VGQKGFQEVADYYLKWAEGQGGALEVSSMSDGVQLNLCKAVREDCIRPAATLTYNDR
jgi:hypothetical protein